MGSGNTVPTPKSFVQPEIREAEAFGNIIMIRMIGQSFMERATANFNQVANPQGMPLYAGLHQAIGYMLMADSMNILSAPLAISKCFDTAHLKAALRAKTGKARQDNDAILVTGAGDFFSEAWIIPEYRFDAPLVLRTMQQMLVSQNLREFYEIDATVAREMDTQLPRENGISLVMESVPSIMILSEPNWREYILETTLREANKHLPPGLEQAMQQKRGKLYYMEISHQEIATECWQIAQLTCLRIDPKSFGTGESVLKDLSTLQLALHDVCKLMKRAENGGEVFFSVGYGNTIEEFQERILFLTALRELITLAGGEQQMVYFARKHGLDLYFDGRDSVQALKKEVLPEKDWQAMQRDINIFTSSRMSLQMLGIQLTPELLTKIDQLIETDLPQMVSSLTKSAQQQSEEYTHWFD